MTDILIIGKNGQVGNALDNIFKSSANVLSLNSISANLTNENELRKLIRNIKPRIIINSAAYNNVDLAETEKALAFKINARGIEIIGEEATKLNASVIHYSTDYVFDGKKKGPYVEDDKVNPLSVYGASKAEGEDLLTKTCPCSIILRTSWIASHHGSNFLKTVIKLAHEDHILKVVDDQHGAPTSAELIAEVTKNIVEVLESDPQGFPYKIYHLTSSGNVSWYEYAMFVIREAKKRDNTFKFNLENIYPVNTIDNSLLAKRPKNSKLDSSLLQKTFGLSLPSWQDCIINIIDRLYKNQ
jgi:dTDP-4-dehydrorhamnose reductase